MNNKYNNKSLKDQVQEILMNEIMSGKLKPGDRLKIIPIAKKLNISQAPVREAIQCLATSGYLELIPNVGVSVRAFTDTEIDEMYEVRRMLELECFNKGGFDMKALAEKLNHILREMADSLDSGDYSSYAIYDIHFHRAFVEAADNSKMLDIWDSLLIPINTKRLKEIQSTTKMESLVYHSPIIRALENGKIDDAKTELIEHYARLKKNSKSRKKS